MDLRGKMILYVLAYYRLHYCLFLFLLKGQNHYKNVKPYGKGDRSHLKRE